MTTSAADAEYSAESAEGAIVAGGLVMALVFVKKIDPCLSSKL